MLSHHRPGRTTLSYVLEVNACATNHTIGCRRNRLICKQLEEVEIRWANDTDGRHLPILQISCATVMGDTPTHCLVLCFAILCVCSSHELARVAPLTHHGWLLEEVRSTSWFPLEPSLIVREHFPSFVRSLLYESNCRTYRGSRSDPCADCALNAGVHFGDPVLHNEPDG
jgi:hypothetical protein